MKVANQAKNMADMANRSLPKRVSIRKRVTHLPSHNEGLRIQKVIRWTQYDSTTGGSPDATDITATKLYPMVLSQLGIGTLATNAIITIFINRMDAYAVSNCAINFAAAFYIKSPEGATERRALVLDEAAPISSVPHLAVVYPPASRPAITSANADVLIRLSTRPMLATLLVATIVDLTVDFHCDITICQGLEDVLQKRLTERAGPLNRSLLLPCERSIEDFQCLSLNDEDGAQFESPSNEKDKKSSLSKGLSRIGTE